MVKYANKDTQFRIKEQTGHSDVYLTFRDQATGPNDTDIIMRDAHGPSKEIFLPSSLRKQYGLQTGTFYLCFYASTPFSALIYVQEKNFYNDFPFTDGQI